MPNEVIDHRVHDLAKQSGMTATAGRAPKLAATRTTPKNTALPQHRKFATMVSSPETDAPSHRPAAMTEFPAAVVVAAANSEFPGNVVARARDNHSTRARRRKRRGTVVAMTDRPTDRAVPKMEDAVDHQKPVPTKRGTASENTPCGFFLHSKQQQQQPSSTLQEPQQQQPAGDPCPNDAPAARVGSMDRSGQRRPPQKSMYRSIDPCSTPAAAVFRPFSRRRRHHPCGNNNPSPPASQPSFSLTAPDGW